MPDITMCKDDECPSAENCYRFIATPSKVWQSYFAKSPRTPDAPRCLYFMDTSVNDRVE